MSTYWLDRLPTAEEVVAHAAAHGRRWWPHEDGVAALGLWAWRSEPGRIPCVGPLRLTDTGDLRMWAWAEDPCDEWVPVAAGFGQWLPLTAEGLPVALVTEVEQLRAELVAERAVSASLREQLARLSGAVLAVPATCPGCNGTGEVSRG